MKHVEIFKEIETKLNEFCDEALHYGGLAVMGSVSQIGSALNQILNYKPPQTTEDSGKK